MVGSELLEPLLAGLLVAIINRCIINNHTLWNNCYRDTHTTEHEGEGDDAQKCTAPVITTTASSDSSCNSTHFHAHVG